MRHSLLLPLLAALAGPLHGQGEAEPKVRRLRNIEIRTEDVFERDTAERYELALLINELHWTTRKEVIEREIWLRPGEPITPEQAEEVERNLRALGLFAEVEVELVPVAGGAGDEADLVVDARDRLTLSFGAGASYVGGVGGVRGSIGENNVLGLGNRIAASFSRNSEDEYRGSIAYTDLHVLDTWYTGSLRYARTDEGESFGIGLRRPFKHLADPFAHGVAAADDEEDVDYYRGGDSVAEVFVHRRQIGGDATLAFGPADDRFYVGVLAELSDREYGTPTGPLGPDLQVPGDTVDLFTGIDVRWDLVTGYRKVDGMDTLDYAQDLQLGLSLGATAGVHWRDEEGAGEAQQPSLSLRASWADEVLPSLYVQLAAGGTARWDAGDRVGWQRRAGAWAFLLTGADNTVGTSVTYDAADEEQDLPVEFTLGEDNGLRGYAARQLSGTRRLRVNLENRFDTALEWATFRLGLVAFADAGWTSFDDDFGAPYRSVGAGLRLGSQRLLGDGVFRLDVAKPLDDVDGEDDGWTVSFSVGQVFTFGGNASSLSSR